MLVLARGKGEVIHIGDDIKITVVGFRHGKGGRQARIGIDAPDDVRIDRAEVREKRIEEGQQ